MARFAGRVLADGFAEVAEVSNRLTSPQADSASAAHSIAGAAPRRRLKLICRPTSVTSSLSAGRYIVPEGFNLPRMAQFDPRPAAALGPPANANSPTFQRFHRNSRRCQSGHRAL